MRARCPSCDRRFTGEVAACPFDETPLVRTLEGEPGQDDGDPEIGTLVANQYRLLEVIGEGGMGVIYRARQETVGRDVAVKILRARFAKEESVVRRFENEARIISQLRHPNTLRLYDTQRMENGRLLLVTEFLEGQSLEELLRGGPIGVDRALSIADQICASLSEAHAVGVVHRDLKPANVFLDRVGGEDYVKVLDFGIAKLAQGNMVKTQANIIMGTPAYMAPEQVRGEAADARSDIYALGVLLYQMLSGQTPFAAENPVTLLMKQVNEAPPPLLEELAVPPELDELVFKMLGKNPAERPQKVSELRDRLRAISRSLGTAEATTSPTDLVSLDRPILRPKEDALDRAIRGTQEDAPTLPTLKRISSQSLADERTPPLGKRGVAMTIPIEIDGPIGAGAPNLELFLDGEIPAADFASRTRRGQGSSWPVIFGLVGLALAGGIAYFTLRRPIEAATVGAPTPTADPEPSRSESAEATPAGRSERAPAAAGTALEHQEIRGAAGARRGAEAPEIAGASQDNAAPPEAAPDTESARDPSRARDDEVPAADRDEGRRGKRRKKKGEAGAVDPLEAATSKILSGGGDAEDTPRAKAGETAPKIPAPSDEPALKAEAPHEAVPQGSAAPEPAPEPEKKANPKADESAPSAEGGDAP